MTVARRKTSDFSKSIRYLSIFLKTTCNPILFSICSHTSRGDATDADLDSPQEQTGKGASLRAPRAESGRPAPLAPGQHSGDRMETGEVEAKVLCGWPERRSSMGLPCNENTGEPRRDIRRGFSFISASPPPCGEVGERSDPGGGVCLPLPPTRKFFAALRICRPPHEGEAMR